jgi:hypothetical protein
MSKQQPISGTTLRAPKPLEIENGDGGGDGTGEPDLAGIDCSTLKNITGGWFRIGVHPRTIRMPDGGGDCHYA